VSVIQRSEAAVKSVTEIPDLVSKLLPQFSKCMESRGLKAPNIVDDLLSHATRLISGVSPYAISFTSERLSQIIFGRESA
jgi:hypothetical protein